MQTSDLLLAHQTRNLPLGRCVACDEALDLCTPHVHIDATGVHAFCSTRCSNAARGVRSSRSRVLARLMRLGLGVPMLGLMSGHEPRAPIARVAVERPALASPSPPTLVAEPACGPAWPPSEDDWTRELAADAWLHPLDGPLRRMPVSDSRVFGAERAGDRPGECEHGHCGVDLSGPWGEPVHAAHAGIVDRVQRGQNDEHGGQYVRLAHREGTVFTQYFHLAAIPRSIQPGVVVHVGELVGLLGDTGVKHSEPHLHFTISVKPSSTGEERFIDPESLIALWPLRIGTGETAAMVHTQEAPGVPLQSSRPHKSRSRPMSAKERAGAEL